MIGIDLQLVKLVSLEGLNSQEQLLKSGVPECLVYLLSPAHRKALLGWPCPFGGGRPGWESLLLMICDTMLAISGNGRSAASKELYQVRWQFG